jgi:hypothetical protein
VTRSRPEAVADAAARPLSKEEYEQWVLDAHRDDQEVRSGLRDVRGGLWRAAKALHHFTEITGWTALGYDGVGDWLADPDVTLTRPTYYRMLQTWQELAVLRKVDESALAGLDMTKTSIVLPALRRGEVTVEELLTDSAALGARDLREKYRGEPAFPTAPTGDDDDLTVPDEPIYAGRTGMDTGVADYVDVDSETMPTVARGIAETLTRVLEAVYKELGSPESKRMSKFLREQVSYALQLAHDESLGDLKESPYA